ncbi:MAG: DUF1573 domain-containing protein, partial [Planctomycetia bacterium]
MGLQLSLLALALTGFPLSRGGEARWATSLFAGHDHDFGVVQRGSLLTHDFVLTNNGSKTLEIKGATVSCGCTKASVSAYRVPVGGTAVVSAVMDTSGFQGPKSVTITVQLAEPRRSTVALRVSCVSKGDAAADGHEIDFGVVSAGTKAAKETVLETAGRPSWAVVAMDHGDKHLDCEVVETSRDAERVRYTLRVTLKDDAPAGDFSDKIRLRTNDPQRPEFFVQVKAMVEASTVVSPPTLRLAGAAPGQQLTRN